MVSTGAIGPSVHPPDEAPAGLSLSSQRVRLMLITSTQGSVSRSCWVVFFFCLSLPDRNLETTVRIHFHFHDKAFVKQTIHSSVLGPVPRDHFTVRTRRRGPKTSQSIDVSPANLLTQSQTHSSTSSSMSLNEHRSQPMQVLTTSGSGATTHASWMFSSQTHISYRRSKILCLARAVGCSSRPKSPVVTEN